MLTIEKDASVHVGIFIAQLARIEKCTLKCVLMYIEFLETCSSRKLNCLRLEKSTGVRVAVVFFILHFPSLCLGGVGLERVLQVRPAD